MAGVDRRRVNWHDTVNPPARGCRTMLRRFSIAALAAASVWWLGAGSPAFAGDETTPMSFRIVAAGKDCAGCVVINAHGEITDDTARDFALFVAENRMQGILPKEAKRGAPADPTAPKVMVAFESIGGKVVPA